MTLDELNAAVAAATDTTKASAAKSVQATLAALQDALAKGDKVSITGFGIFEISDRPARTGRNPQTGQEIKIAASKAVKFKAGKQLRDAVNK